MCKKEIKKIFKKYGYRPKVIHGTDFPSNFMMFRNWMRLAGRDIYFHYTDLGVHKINEATENSYTELSNLLHLFDSELESAMEAIGQMELSEEDMKSEKDNKRQVIADAYEERLTAAYKVVLEVELKHGLVRVVQLREHYNKNAVVKSNYGDWKLNYSPVILSIPTFEEEDSIHKHAALFANAYLRPFPCSLIRVHLGRNVNEKEVPQIYKMMAEVINVFNAKSIEEYEEKKEDEEYQHRDDWDPADF